MPKGIELGSAVAYSSLGKFKNHCKVCTFLRTFRLNLDRHPDGLAEEGTGVQVGLISLVPIRMESLYNRLRIPGQVPHRTRSKAIVGALLVSQLSCQRKKLLFRDGGGWVADLWRL